MNSDSADLPTYNLYLNSSDKISGTHNQATFNINWDSFLPREYNAYKVRYSFVTSAGNYKDNAGVSSFSNCRIDIDFQGRSYSYNSATGGQSNILGFAERVPAGPSSLNNAFSCSFNDHPPKTISRPTQNTLTVNIINIGKQANVSNAYLLDTSGVNLAADMTPWSLILEFTPIISSKNT